METRAYAIFFLIVTAVIVLARPSMQVATVAGGEGLPSKSPQAASAQTRPDPCNRMSPYHDLDFWLGKWDVFDKATGRKAGTNEVEKSLNNCAVIEHWRGSGGEIGSSVNTINPSSGKWQQDWVSGSGVVSHFEGQVSSGAMQFSGARNMYGTAATPIRLILQPLPEGAVRQTGEAQGKDGKWSVSYDLIYRRPQ